MFFVQNLQSHGVLLALQQHQRRLTSRSAGKRCDVSGTVRTAQRPLICSQAVEASGGAEATENSKEAASSKQSWLSMPSLRKVTATADANEATDVLLQELENSISKLTETQCRDIISACLERGNVPLALSIFDAMTAAATGGATLSWDGGFSSGSNSSSGFWPAATIETAGALVIGLSQALHTREAIAVINSVRNRGLPTADDVHFGFVVDCPGAYQGKPLTVMQPQEGSKMVVDSYTRWVQLAVWLL